MTENGVLIDTVAYTGLAPARSTASSPPSWTSQAATRLPGDDGLPKVGTTVFTPETPDGTMDVTVNLDTTELAGKSVVFFEKLTDETESVIAVHEDMDDEGQTVTFPGEEPGSEAPGKGYPKTGGIADVDPVVASIVVIVLCGCAGAGYACIRRARSKAKESDLHGRGDDIERRRILSDGQSKADCERIRGSGPGDGPAPSSKEACG